MIVVDTHAWFWWLTEDTRLSRMARSRLNREREVVVPAICLWEIALMSLRGRVALDYEVNEFISRALEWDGVTVAPLTPAIGIVAAKLAQTFTLDPADQLIAATAMDRRVPRATADERLTSLPGLQTLW